MRQAVRFPFYAYGRPRIYGLSGNMLIDGPVKSGMIVFNHSMDRIGAPSLMSVQSEICNRGTIIFKGSCDIGTGNKIYVYETGKLTLGAYTRITDMCNVGCFTTIEMGDQSWLTHRGQMMDSNYHFLANFNKRIIPAYTAPIKIGTNCWIGNSTTVVGGTVLPDYTIVGSNSLVNKSVRDIPENSIIGGIPAKLISTGFRRVNNRELEQFLLHNLIIYPEAVYQMPEDMTMDDVSRL